MENETCKQTIAYQLSLEQPDTEDASIKSESEDEQQGHIVALSKNSDWRNEMEGNATRDAQITEKKENRNQSQCFHYQGAYATCDQFPARIESREDIIFKPTEKHVISSQGDNDMHLEESAYDQINRIRNNEQPGKEQLMQLEILENKALSTNYSEISQPKPLDKTEASTISLRIGTYLFEEKSNLNEKLSECSNEKSLIEICNEFRKDDTRRFNFEEVKQAITRESDANEPSVTHIDKQNPLRQNSIDEVMHDQRCDSAGPTPTLSRKSLLNSQEFKKHLELEGPRQTVNESNRVSTETHVPPERENQVSRRVPVQGSNSLSDPRQLQELEGNVHEECLVVSKSSSFLGSENLRHLEGSILGKHSIGRKRLSFSPQHIKDLERNVPRKALIDSQREIVGSQQLTDLEGSILRKSHSGIRRPSNVTQQLEDIEGNLLRKSSINSQMSSNAEHQLRDLEGSVLRKASIESSASCSKTESNTTNNVVVNNGLQPGAYYAEYSIGHSLDEDVNDVNEEIYAVEGSAIVTQREVRRENSTLTTPNSPFGTKMPSTKRRRTVVVAIISLIFIIGVASIGTVIGLHKHEKPKKETADNACIDRDMVHAPFRVQCDCTGRIRHISVETQEAYYKLLDEILPTLYNDYNEDIYSCSARNLALVQAASQEKIDAPNLLQRFLLSLMYLEWKGDNWQVNTGWLSENPVCTWYGVSCSDGLVTGLDLPENQLDGGLARELFFLRSLGKYEYESNLSAHFAIFQHLFIESLVLSRNNVAGNLPTEIGLLTSLTRLAFDGINLKGDFPTEIGRLTALKELDISALYGLINHPIPTEIGFLTNLKVLNVTKNRIVGVIPSEIGLLSDLGKFRKHNLYFFPWSQLKQITSRKI